MGHHRAAWSNPRHMTSEIRSGKAARAEAFVRMLRDAGVAVDRNTRILDLGCGAGRLVEAARGLGYQFYGAGVNMHDAHHEANSALIEQGVLRPIRMEPYRIPYDDEFFDAIISDMVFEHVMDYPTTLRETRRILKPGGAFLHLFPSRYQLIEPHVFVPLGTMLRTRWWLKVWALAGIRNEFQKKLSAAEAAEANYRYLNTCTNYLPRRELVRNFSRYFTDVRFAEDAFLKNSRRGRKIYQVARWVPFSMRCYSALWHRAAFGRRGIAAPECSVPAATASRVQPPSAAAARISEGSVNVRSLLR
jgi:SAM-dependent methyltransferase